MPPTLYYNIRKAHVTVFRTHPSIYYRVQNIFLSNITPHLGAEHDGKLVLPVTDPELIPRKGQRARQRFLYYFFSVM